MSKNNQLSNLTKNSSSEPQNFTLFVGNFGYFINLLCKLSEEEPSNKYTSICSDYLDKFNKQKLKIHRIIKRFNVYLKIHPSEKLTYEQMAERFEELVASDSIVKDDYKLLNSSLEILPKLPFSFILKDRLHVKLVWLYVKSLYYTSNTLLIKDDMQSLDDLNRVTQEIVEYETVNNISETVFKVKKQNAEEFNTSNIRSATQQIKESFMKGGSNPTLELIIDNIAKNMESRMGDFESGNIFSLVMDIAQESAASVKDLLPDNPEDAKNLFKGAEGVMQDMFSKVDMNAEGMDPKLGQMFSFFMNSMNNPEQGNDNQMADEGRALLSQIAESKGMSAEQLITQFSNENGDFDADRFQNFLLSQNIVKQV